MPPAPDTYVYQRLTVDDIARARELCSLFAQAFEDPSSYLDRPPSDDYLAGLLGRPHVIVLVALAGDDVIGGLVAYALEKIEQHRSEIYIYDLAVDEKHRRRGVATKLIRALRPLAAEWGAEVIFVQADPEDEPARALYRSLGTEEAPYHYDIPVAVHDERSSR